MWHLGTVADAEHCQLDAVGAEGLDVSVVHEADAPHVDHPQVGGGLHTANHSSVFTSCQPMTCLLERADVEDLVHLALLLLALLVGAVQVEHLHAVDEVVNLLHEVVQENRLAETQTQVPGSGEEISKSIFMNGCHAA